jgi:hypothetical protein
MISQQDGPCPLRPGPRTWARSSRASLVWGLAFCALLQLGMSVAIMPRWSRVRAPVYGHRLALLEQRIAERERPLTVVMLGSSRTAHGFLAGMLDDRLSRVAGRPVAVFNFGMVGAGPVTNLVNLKRLLNDGIRPDLLLVEVLPPLLASDVPLLEVREERLPTPTLRWDEMRLLAHYALPERKRLELRWVRSVLSPWYSHRLEILARSMPVLLRIEERDASDFPDVGPSGWSRANWADHCPPERRRRALATAHKEYAEGYLRGFHLGGRPVVALHETLRLCRSAGIPVALVLMPEGPAFRSWYPPGAREEITTFLAGLQRDYGTRVIDARDWIGEDDFLDSHHLLPTGARIFTRRLGDEGIAPLLGNHGKGVRSP